MITPTPPVEAAAADPHADLRAIGWPLDALPAAGGQDLLPAQELPVQQDWARAWGALLAAHPQARPARVSEQHRSGYVVAEGPEHALAAEAMPEWLRRRFPAQQRAGVGDWVLIEGADSEAAEGSAARAQIVALLPRRSVIKRAAAGEHYHQQVIAANVDTVFVVCGLDADFNPRRIERYLLLVRGGGAEPVVVLTKADKAGSDAAASLTALSDLAAQGFAAVAVNALDAASVTALAPWLRPGRTAVLVGSSGAGKSTLTNSLLGYERMKTGAVRDSDDRGRHTTTHRSLIPLPSGACLIDTPGMRELKPTGEEDLADGGFADVEALAAQCRFRDCRHAREPGCAVRAAIEAGELDARRFANYLKLRDEVAGAAASLAARQAQKGEARRPTRAPQRHQGDEDGEH